MPRTSVVGTAAPPGSGVQRCALAGEHEHRTVRTATAAPLGCAPPILGADPGGVRRRQQPEAQIQSAVFQHFRARGAPGVFAFHPANGGFRRPVEAAILKGLGVRAGVPDLIACRGGRFYALELKTDTGKLSDAQEQVLAALREAGAEVAVTYGLDAALAQLERWQLLRGVES